jgi:NAD(P)-dependent dehydrogenase (short-subunit alcohol dehydrogenase family)
VGGAAGAPCERRLESSHWTTGGHRIGKDVETFEKERAPGFPLGRIALPEEVADLVCFLASERASFLTGIAITVDGGITRGVYL